MSLPMHPDLLALWTLGPTATGIDRIRTLLETHGSLDFPTLPNGLFPAAVALSAEYDYTGYSNVWVRDNVLVAHSHDATGKSDKAAAALTALMTFFKRYRHRFDDIICGGMSAADATVRPHIRFRGEDLTENPERWAHAQNDAIGYFLWLYSRLAVAGALTPRDDDWSLLAAVVCYLDAIQYWQDEDSGHWEEVLKVAASSIGTVVAGLRAVRRLAKDAGEPKAFSHRDEPVTIARVDELIAKGLAALDEILPAETVHGTEKQKRRYDAALLFLISPLEVVSEEMGRTIVAEVLENLSGEYGIRRYNGDSYWCADYKALVAKEQRTTEFSDDMDARDSLLKPGTEAQWCIFDSLLSVIHGRWYLRHRRADDREAQFRHLERALRQLTAESSPFGGWKCPESYYLEDGKWGPNDITPLLWTQANLLLALQQAGETLNAE